MLLDGVPDVAATAEFVRRLEPAGWVEDTGPAEMVTIDVCFDGEDLAEVARLWDTDERGVVDRLVGTELHVAFCGFTPGWAYLAGLPEELAVPRRPNPRPRVPAGSVGLADRYAGIYPTASPGGWQLVGRTDVKLFDPDRTPPALLTPGTRVRFVETAAS